MDWAPGQDNRLTETELKEKKVHTSQNPHNPDQSLSRSCTMKAQANMSTQISMHRHLVLLLLALAAGCAPTDAELFRETQALLAEGTGDACTFEAEIGSAEVNIDDRAVDCPNGLACVSVGESAAEHLGVDPTDGVCACRCDGPAGSGPYCSCIKGTHCALLVKDASFPQGSASYCMED